MIYSTDIISTLFNDFQNFTAFTGWSPRSIAGLILLKVVIFSQLNEIEPKSILNNNYSNVS